MWVIDLINAVAWPLTLLFAIRWFRDAYIDARMADERDQMRREREAMVIDRKKFRELQDQVLVKAPSTYTTYTYDQKSGYVNERRINAVDALTQNVCEDTREKVG